jgi:hypothetical protein
MFDTFLSDTVELVTDDLSKQRFWNVIFPANSSKDG